MPHNDEPHIRKHDHHLLRFPDDFLWGTATSAHQVEGNNIYSDWWANEQRLEPQFRSGRACDQYNLYEKDFDMAKSLNHNAHRLSIEWSRIEPKDGEFDHHEIEHYISVLKALKVRNFTVMLTLWHFTLPKWLADKGGWENPRTIYYFERFVKRIVPDIKQYVDIWVTLNEPGVYVFIGYLTGEWIPHKKSKWAALKVYWNLLQAHKRVYKLLHFLDHKSVGIAHNVQSFESYHKHSLREQLAVIINDLLTNHSLYILTRGYHDYIGINYYFHHRFKPEEGGFLPKIHKITADYTRDISDLGWEVYPEGIFDVLLDLSDHLPIYVTECGIATTNDDRRTRFLVHYLQEIYRAIKAGVNVKGFFYWSLLDNFEWHKGFTPRFGLVEVDYKTQQRSLRPSSKVYAEIIRRNGISHYMLRFIGHTVKAEQVLKGLERYSISHPGE